jgi:ectoine hydroxylase-related dioxygenase (phytanoyl-CoA dioxygenase family)
MNENFSNKGYYIVRNALRPRLLLEIQKDTLSYIKNKKKTNEKNNYASFSKAIDNLKIKEFDFIKPIFEKLFLSGILDKILLEKKLFKNLSSLLGRDLSYAYDVSMTLNRKTKPNENYFFKDWHQEIWSGASISSVQMWTPLFQKNNLKGQMELIVGSHRWGHIPHKNRKPIFLPSKYKTIKLNLKYGDVILFSSLLLHRSAKTDFPRLALSLLIKNFKYKNESFEENRNWKIFSISQLTKIQRYLGNHYLSPYRLLDIGDKNNINSGILPTKNVK